MMWFDGNMGWGWGLVGIIWMILFWGIIIGLIVWTINRLTGRTAPPSGTTTPLDIAKARYARGEITKEQFEELKRDLQ